MLILVFVVLVVLSMIFWIFMLIDCAKRKFKEDNEKVIWIIVIALLGIIGSAVYYFAVKRASSSSIKTRKK